MAASSPEACLQPHLSSLNITGKSVRIFKTKGIAEIALHARSRWKLEKNVGLRYGKANKRLHVMKYHRKSALIIKKDNSLIFKSHG